MTKQIRTYQDLLDEKEHLETLLAAQKELIHQDIAQLRTEFQPTINAIGVLGKLLTKDKTNSLLNTGADTLIDIFVKRLILGRAGWLTRLMVPFFLKNLSSHFIADKKENIFQKLFSWFGKHHNGKMPPDPDPASIRKESSNGEA